MVELQGPNVQYQAMTLLTFDCPVVPRCLVSNDFNIDPVPWDPVDLTCYYRVAGRTLAMIFGHIHAVFQVFQHLFLRHSSNCPSTAHQEGLICQGSQQTNPNQCLKTFSDFPVFIRVSGTVSQ